METTPNPDEMSLTECGVHHATCIPRTQRNAERRICASFAIVRSLQNCSSIAFRPDPAHLSRALRILEQLAHCRREGFLVTRGTRRPVSAWATYSS